MCQERTHAPQQKESLFDHRVGDHKHIRENSKAEHAKWVGIAAKCRQLQTLRGSERLLEAGLAHTLDEFRHWPRRVRNVFFDPGNREIRVDFLQASKRL